MKFYLLEGHHLVSFDQIPAALIEAHHQFLQTGYDDGHFLFSGPQLPAHGGFLVARVESRQQLDALLAEEPFVREGVMEFSAITEFEAAQCQPFLNEWFGK